VGLSITKQAQGGLINMTTPLQHVAYIETVLKDVSHVLRALHEDQRFPNEQRSRLSGCLDELAHALLDLQDDETGLKVLLDHMYAFYESVEPPVTRSWTRVRGTLLECVEKMSDIYFYTSQEDQGGHDWRVLVLHRESECFERHVFTPQQLLERIKQHPDATRAAILDYDTSWFGEAIKVDWADGQTEPNLWVHAKVYRLGKNEPVALVYRIDFEEEEEDECPGESEA
jgi:hypothetical protein